MTTMRRVHGELDVAAAGVDADRAGGGDRDVAHVLVLAVGQRHGRRDGDRVAGVHAHRVDVLDRADDDDVVLAVAHQLELELLPAQDRLLQEHLGDRAGVQPEAGDPAQLPGVAGDARAGAAEGERGPDDHREAELGGRRLALRQGVADPALRRLGADVGDDLLELAAVLAGPDGVDAGPDELHVVPGQRPGLVQADGRVQGGLAAQGGQDRVGALLGDDLLQDVLGDGLDVGGVGELGVGHDRRGVGVDQADPDALLAQHPAGLGAGVVELAGLPDDDRPRADDQDGLQVVTLGHAASPGPLP
jgi:hypothetical protein